MVLPENLRRNLTPAEIQYLCEYEMVSILPRYAMPKVDLISVCISSSPSSQILILISTLTSRGRFRRLER
ncbi:hypothetical protein METSCH_B08570 [Metschnikowia aff. pulcherrima]|uniref:DNA replication complex GINS protein PSF2 N-terminal domain-containing protein n=1 Tax=Metschnikowia aff. pulcherrima TaxID=2163413 RepID=A0A4P6XKB2_9ASCO|nr:hypothetical protein METSCH_B08570 [Metschnikowia aff. pulcherrima]